MRAERDRLNRRNNRNGRNRKILAAATAVFALAPIVAYAGLSHSDYLDALQKAQAKAQRARPATTESAQPGVGDILARADGSPLVQRLFGRAYRVGDAWNVAAFAESSTMARKSNNANDLPHLLPAEDHPGHTGIFHYEVVAVQNGVITLRITQVDSHDLKPVDSGVSWLGLSVDSQFIQVKKEYQLRGSKNPIGVSAEGVHSHLSRLELFPLDAPDLGTALQSPAKQAPRLPSSLAEIVGSPILSGAVGSATWFEQDDFFGRPIRALWRQGDPWPAYLSTINGVAILL